MQDSLPENIWVFHHPSNYSGNKWWSSTDDVGGTPYTLTSTVTVKLEELQARIKELEGA